MVSQDADGGVHVHSKLLCFPNEGMPFTGDYNDQMARTSDGWRIARRRAELRARKFLD